MFWVRIVTNYWAAVGCLLAALFCLLTVPLTIADDASRKVAPATNAAAAAEKSLSLPPIFKSGERILFQGDSTIDGARWHSTDLKHAIWQDYAYIIASEYGSAPDGHRLVFINRTVPGDRIADLADRWPQDTLAVKPDVVSILIGVNDLFLNFSESRSALMARYEKTYGRLLDETRAANPRVKIILCAPFVLPGKNTTGRWDEWLEIVGELQTVVDRRGASHRVPVVHFQPLFHRAVPSATGSGPDAELEHPTYAEQRWMADEWVRVYQNYYGLAEPGKLAADGRQGG